MLEVQLLEVLCTSVVCRACYLGKFAMTACQDTLNFLCFLDEASYCAPTVENTPCKVRKSYHFSLTLAVNLAYWRVSSNIQWFSVILQVFHAGHVSFKLEITSVYS